LTLYGVELVLLDDEEGVASAVADVLVEAAGGGGSIVLTGGESPGRAYELAARREPDWSSATLWWGDERCVTPDDERSNYRLARMKLLEGLSEQPGEIHRIRGELGGEAASLEYEEALAGAELGLVLLGIGPDGHAASLFPGQPTLQERDRRAIPAEAKLEPFVERVTLTVPVLCSAPEVVFLVTGKAKADAVERAFGRPASPEAPSSLIRSAGGRTRVFADRAAAAKLH
jgi:6-phosphogluconolactonase